jgi:hypothetical protein
MNNKEQEKYKNEFIKYMDEQASSKSKARDFLIRLGVCNKKGKLTRNYK